MPILPALNSVSMLTRLLAMGSGVSPALSPALTKKLRAFTPAGPSKAALPLEVKQRATVVDQEIAEVAEGLLVGDLVGVAVGAGLLLDGQGV